MRKTTKKRRLKKSVKRFLKASAVAVVFFGCLFYLIGEIKSELNAYEQQKQEERQKYIECIKEQDARQGWIVRSACSNEWQRLDAETHAQYKQIKKDVYLIKIGE